MAATIILGFFYPINMYNMSAFELRFKIYKGLKKLKEKENGQKKKEEGLDLCNTGLKPANLT